MKLIMNKLNLKPEELTFANVIENNYNFSDINESIGILILLIILYIFII